MKQVVLSLFILLSCAILLLAQAGAGDINDAAHETTRLRLVNSFQRAILAQQVKLRADADFDSARNDYTDLAEKTAGELKLPKGSEFVIDGKGGVQVKLPPPAPAKPAEPKLEDKK